MKKNISLIVITLQLLALTSFAQKSKVTIDQENFFRFGAKAGVNANKLTGQSYKAGFNYNYQLGGFLQFNFSNRFGIQPEVNFVQTSTEFTNDITDVYDDLFRDGTQKKAKLNYLEIPVLLNINVGVSKHVKLQVGPSYGFLMKQSVDSLLNPKSLYKNGEWAAIGGLWVQLPLINFGARYKLGLTDINGIDNQQKWKSQSIQVFVGITL
ncbi:MAG: porin family protein [Ferruginibacter sp.]